MNHSVQYSTEELLCNTCLSSFPHVSNTPVKVSGESKPFCTQQKTRNNKLRILWPWKNIRVFLVQIHLQTYSKEFLCSSLQIDPRCYRNTGKMNHTESLGNSLPLPPAMIPNFYANTVRQKLLLSPSSACQTLRGCHKFSCLIQVLVLHTSSHDLP